MLAVAVHDALAGGMLRLFTASYAEVVKGKAGWHKDTTGRRIMVPSHQ